jgi:replication factor C subunit 2/4
MTPSAQQALRRTMELFSNTTRFALACNISNKIIEAIQSRCAILRFSKLSDEQMLKRLLDVTAKENVTTTDKGLEAILFTAEGDMRNALNSLQATYAGFGIVDDKAVYKVCDQPHPAVIQKLIALCQKNDVDGAIQEFQVLWKGGYSSSDIIGTLFKVVKFSDMKEGLKLEYIKQIGYTHMRIIDGLCTQLQILGLIARLCESAATDSSN